MINIRLIALLILSGCTTKDTCLTDEPFSPLSANYIVLESTEGMKYCLPYFELSKLTPFNYLELDVGKEERINFFCGNSKITKFQFEELRKANTFPIFEVNKNIKNTNLDSLLQIAIDSSNSFKLKSVDVDFRGNVIEKAIHSGYLVYFDDYRGEYFYSK